MQNNPIWNRVILTAGDGGVLNNSSRHRQTDTGCMAYRDVLITSKEGWSDRKREKNISQTAFFSLFFYLVYFKLFFLEGVYRVGT